MSDPAKNTSLAQTEEHEGPEPGGINLPLVYSLLALALLGAILFACFIVWPFYIRR